MTELDPDARALVEAGRRALRGTEADRDRIEAALRARLGESALPPAASGTPASTATSFQTLGAAVIGVSVLVGIGLYALRPAPSSHEPASTAPAALEAPTTATDKSAQAPRVTPEAPELEATTESEDPPRSMPQAVSASHLRDSLAREVALLSRATSALRANRPADAMKALGEHERSFPTGALVQERSAAKAQALCLLGRVADGRAQLARLAAGSPAAAAARQVCSDAASGSSESP